MSSEETNEKREMYITSSNLENMIWQDIDKIITKNSNFVLHRCKYGLQTVKGSEFLFDFAERMLYKFHTTHLNWLGLCIDSPK